MSEGLKQALYQREQAFLHGLEVLYPDEPLRCNSCKSYLIWGHDYEEITPRVLARVLATGNVITFTATVQPDLAARLL